MKRAGAQSTRHDCGWAWGTERRAQARWPTGEGGVANSSHPTGRMPVPLSAAGTKSNQGDSARCWCECREQADSLSAEALRRF